MNPFLIGALALASALNITPVHAGPGHDHGGEAETATSNAPRRQPDGSVFLPKPSQRQLALRTLVAEEKTLPQSIELTGRVIMDPHTGGRVQPTQAGRIEAGPRGLPQLGQAVRKGEVLAVLRASAGAIDRANQQSQAAELSAQLEQARRRVERLTQLEGTVPHKDIEAAQADARSLQQRAAAVGSSVSATELLVAPVSGVVSTANALAGQVVDARELLFEIVDPAHLLVEAQAFDAALPGNIAGAHATPGAGVSVPLRFAGAGLAQREGAIPLHFRTASGQAVPLAVNQPVKVVIQTKAGIQGMALPAAAVVKSPSNQDMVWVHTGAETFVPRTVRVMALDGAQVSVVHGLQAGDRVVTQGAALLNQVR
jgi:multidrug resistance efflux pump